MRPWIFLLALFLLVNFQNVFAQSTQVQPILGFSWPTHSIPVSINAPEPNARQAVLNAMRTWNLAQQWFITTYMASQGAPFVFYETNATLGSMVTVSFNQTQTTEYLGWTSSHELHDQQGNFLQVTVSITIDLTEQGGAVVPDVDLQRLAAHEMGHALGLDDEHTNFIPDDLMNPVPQVIFPSTLNLYAVYLLSTVTNMKNLPQQPVSLPDNIPYILVSQADLDSVTAPVAQTTMTTSFDMNQVLFSIAYGPWLWVGLLAALAAVVVASTSRRQKRGSAKVEPKAEAPVVFRDESVIERGTSPSKPVKTCRYCGAEVRPDRLICDKCGMPAGYL